MEKTREIGQNRPVLPRAHFKDSGHDVKVRPVSLFFHFSLQLSSAAQTQTPLTVKNSRGRNTCERLCFLRGLMHL